MSNIIPPKYCFVDAQNIETHFFIEGMKINQKPIKINHRNLFNYLINNLKSSPSNIFLFYSSHNFSLAKKLVLESIGFNVVLCEAKREDRDGKNHHNVDTDLIIKSLTSYYEGEDHDVILVTDDGDFLPLVQFYEERNASVQLIGTKQGRGGMSNKLITKNFDTGKNRSIVYLDQLFNYNILKN